jgi:hypothetical protein
MPAGKPTTPPGDGLLKRIGPRLKAKGSQSPFPAPVIPAQAGVARAALSRTAFTPLTALDGGRIVYYQSTD